MTLGQEGGAAVAEYILASRYGLAAGSGGAVVGVGTISYLGAKALTEAVIEGAAEQRAARSAREILSGMTDENQPVPGLENPQRQPLPDGRVGNRGFLEFMGVPPPSEQQMEEKFAPGQYGDSLRVEVDPRTKAVTFRRKTTILPMQYASLNPHTEETWDMDKKTVPRNELMTNIQMTQLFDHMRGKYRDALDSGSVQEAGLVQTSYGYSDGINTFSIPNPGGLLTQLEYTYYRKLFDDDWNRYTARAQQPWSADDLFAAKKKMFQQMMQSVVEGKERDMQFQQALDKMTPEELEALKRAVDSKERKFNLNGRELTSQHLQDRINLATSVREGALKKILDDFKKSGITEDDRKRVDVLVSTTGLTGVATPGDVEFGVLAYSGDCKAKFWFHPFSRQYRPLKKAIDSLSPGGGTPMSPALYQARWAIWTEGKGQRGTIILLTDGQNDCADSPVAAAERIYKRVDTAAPVPGQSSSLETIPSFWNIRLMARAFAAQATGATSPRFPGYHQIDTSLGQVSQQRRNMPISVSTVGFRVNDAQQEALDRIAGAGGGVSARADNLGQLALAFGSAIGAASPGAMVGSGGGGGVPSRRGGLSGVMLGSMIFWSLALLLLLAIVAMRQGYFPALLGSGRAPNPGFAGGTAGQRLPGTKIDLHLSIDEPGGSRAAHFRLAPVRIGRDPSNDLVLEDERVSRQHAEIVVEQGKLYLLDKGSATGTYLDGRKVARATVCREAEIKLGDTRLSIG